MKLDFYDVDIYLYLIRHILHNSYQSESKKNSNYFIHICIYPNLYIPSEQVDDARGGAIFDTVEWREFRVSDLQCSKVAYSRCVALEDKVGDDVSKILWVDP